MRGSAAAAIRGIGKLAAGIVPARRSGVTQWLWAAFWGGVAGSALLFGAAAAWLVRVPERVLAAVMAFGAGVLISALAFDLMDEAYMNGGFDSTSVGFLAGAAIYTAATVALNHHGARHRKRSGQQPSEEQHPGSGTAIAVGALIDGIPESIAIGISLLHGGVVSAAAVAAVFLSNIREGMSSAAGMFAARRTPRYVFGVWGAIAIASALSALAGYAVFSHFSVDVIAATTAVAAGAILAMLVDTMIPEAFAEAHNLAGLITVAGFLAAFALTKLSSR